LDSFAHLPMILCMTNY